MLYFKVKPLIQELFIFFPPFHRIRLELTEIKLSQSSLQILVDQGKYIYVVAMILA